MAPRRHEIWRHSKTGNRYEIREISAVESSLGVGRQTYYTISYFPLYEMGKQTLAFIGATSFQRPLEEWEEIVTLDSGAKVPRFFRVNDQDQDPQFDIRTA